MQSFGLDGDDSGLRVGGGGRGRRLVIVGSRRRGAALPVHLLLRPGRRCRRAGGGGAGRLVAHVAAEDVVADGGDGRSIIGEDLDRAGDGGQAVRFGDLGSGYDRVMCDFWRWDSSGGTG